MRAQTSGNVAHGDGEQSVQNVVDIVAESPALSSLAKLMKVEDWRFRQSSSSPEFATIEGQERSIRRIAKVLNRSRQRHALLVGQNGVGKTTIMQKFANEVCRDRYDFLNGNSILYFNVSNVGAEDSRACIETILSAVLTGNPMILCIDEVVHLFTRPHAGTNKPVLRAMLSQPNISVVATMHHWDFVDHVLADRLMRDCFTKIEVSEPTQSESISIATVAAKRLAGQFDLHFAQGVVERAVSLSSTFVLSDYQPAKTIRTLEQVCEDHDFDRRELGQSVSEVTSSDIENIISDRTGIPVEAISGQGRTFDFEQAIRDAVVGQDDAIRQAAQELQLIAAGLLEPNKPASVMMFAGTTGVGKTQLAKRIAELYSTSGRLQVYSMGNYTESHSVSGLMGVPPGYVGHEEGGKLVSDLLADPYSVFLFDEAEKCHPNVWKPFLNLFDEGWIIDQRGRKAYADRAIFILTTNAGDRGISQLYQSGLAESEVIDHARKALSRVRQERSSQPVFPPQFLARIKRILVFRPLSEQAMAEIVRRNLRLLIKRWHQTRKKQLIVSEEAINAIIREAVSLNNASEGQEGGRIANKLLSEKLEHTILCHSLYEPDRFETCETIKVIPAHDDTDRATGFPLCIAFE